MMGFTKSPGRFACAAVAVLILAALAPQVLAEEEAPPIAAADVMFTVNNVWMMVAAFLVFIMHLGFATLESGLTRAKNTTNILFKNTGIVTTLRFESQALRLSAGLTCKV